MTPQGLDMAILEEQTNGMKTPVRNTVSVWLDAENELAHAMTLYGTAVDIQHTLSLDE